MTSPAQSEAAILPSLLVEARFLERTIFHLDGPNALQHFDRLMSLPEINGLQWIYGAGHKPGGPPYANRGAG